MSNKKKNCVKKGKESGIAFADRMNAAGYIQRQESRFAGQCDTDQIICMALGRVLSKKHTKEWMQRFYRELDTEVAAVTADYSQLVKDDWAGNSDKESVNLSMTKVKFDRELMQYMGDMFAGWDLRWAFERHTIGLRSGSSTNIPPEVEKEMREKAAWTVKAGIR